ncbi:hypothetical protein WJX73_010893 [Symbiochloris irregularis]|uniref:HIRAN domain-containing protein n=1 Tax=Symbiochloris irregularis TaxID=706552 RepID=A0AAW1P9B0_9CHLO
MQQTVFSSHICTQPRLPVYYARCNVLYSATKACRGLSRRCDQAKSQHHLVSRPLSSYPAGPHPSRISPRSSSQQTQAVSGPGVGLAASPLPVAPPSDSALPAIEARRSLEISHAREVYRAVGVSFGGRQEAVAALKVDEAIMLMREPTNPADPNAVQILRLDGLPLGYLPRQTTDRIPSWQELVFGTVESVGRGSEADSKWGFKLAIRPQMPTLAVDAIPSNLRPLVHLQQHLERDDWERIERDASRAGNFRCHITGGKGTSGDADVVHCHEVWAADEARKVLRLVCVLPIAPEVHAVKHVLTTQDKKWEEVGQWTLQAVNEWSMAEVWRYLDFVTRTAAARSAENWRLDLSWLESQGIQLPAALKAVSV